MAPQCPLCGKAKPEKDLFCGDCARKMKSEYEVNIPPDPEEAPPADSNLPQSAEEVEPAVGIPPETGFEARPRRRLKIAIRVVLAIVLLSVAGFYAYKHFVLANNLERIEWDAAVKENTVEGYLSFIQKYPAGKYSDGALKNVRTLKDMESQLWERMKFSENTAELQGFLRQYPESSYMPLVKTRLDSLMWIAALRTNTAQAYSDYIAMSENGTFQGDYVVPARQRYEMLHQEYPVGSGEIDSLKLVVDGFFIALSNVDYNGLNKYLAPSVSRFFGLGTATRDQLVNRLMMAGAKTSARTIKFTPDINALAYEKNGSGKFSCNVPLSKLFLDADSVTKSISGYIAHIEMNPNFSIASVYESKPSSSAP